ncbi:type I-E CRISPR-associated protein Cse2/CasB [Corynebacterium pacaense]|uniref:type I-E CRISPR-associated protein Cse2/CasB n=1 Tax=Corynebacterium pacaense TaxID=1816684 RepID=UPI0009B95F21|nr:type I-E CRISPR-associated protein Cse2/CasB [Corynebacterium pacaense]
MNQTISKRQAVANHTARKLHELEAGIRAETSSSKATLARLRRAVNQSPGSIPDVWGITLGDLPQQLVGVTDTPSWGETAVHNALALFAIQQQGRGEFMHQKGQGLGTGVRRYIILKDAANGFNEESPILRRFNALSTSDSVDELLWHLRSLITQLRGEKIPLDFVELASQIYDFHVPEARDRVRLNWGRQLYTAPSKSTNTQS